MFAKEGGQQHLVVGAKGQSGSKVKDRVQEQRQRWSEEGQADNWRERKVEVSLGQKILKVVTKGILLCQEFFNVKLMGF